MKLNRFIYHVKNDKTFAIISSFDDNFDKKKHYLMKKDIIKLEKGFFELTGKYKNKKELSVFISNVNIKKIIKIAIKYKQKSIIIKDKNVIKRIDTKNEIGKTLKIFNNFKINKDNDYLTYIKNKKIYLF
jgi:hypothetical protein